MELAKITKTVLSVWIILLFMIAVRFQSVEAFHCLPPPREPECNQPLGNWTSGCNLWTSATMSPVVYNLPRGISICADGVTLDCSGATMQGTNMNSISAILMYGRHDTTITNCMIRRYDIGIYSLQSNRTSIISNTIAQTVGSGGYGAIYFGSSNDGIIRNNHLESNNRGIFLESYSNGNIITQNNASANTYGIYVYMSANNTVSENEATSNAYNGIKVHGRNNDANGNLVVDNIVTGNGGNPYGIPKNGIYLDTVADGIVARNTVEANGFGAFGGPKNGIYLWNVRTTRVADNIVHANNENGIHLALSGSDNMIINNSAERNGKHGIFVEQSYNNNITSNYLLINTESGIGVMTGASSNILANNTATRNVKSGISLTSSRYNVLMYNILTNNQEQGIALNTASLNNVTSNIVTNNQLSGVRLLQSSQNYLTKNNITENHQFGISLEANSGLNVISRNNVSLNTLDGVHVLGSTNNLLSYNTLIRNANGLSLDASSNTNLVQNNTILNNTNGIFLQNSLSNNLRSNEVCSNTVYDIDNQAGASNSGNANTCDRQRNWNDLNAAGCTFRCTQEIPVLLVHGIYADDSVWDYIAPLLTRAGYHVFRAGQVLGQPGLVPSNGDIRVLSNDLRRAILRVKALTSAEQVDIVAHSQGGLESRYYIEGPAFRHDVRKLIMVSTPNHGSDLAGFRKNLARIVAFLITRKVGLSAAEGVALSQSLERFSDALVGPSAVQMETHSTFLARLNGNIYAPLHRQFPAQFPRFDKNVPPPPPNVFYYNIEGRGYPTLIHRPVMMIGSRELQTFSIHDAGDLVVHIDSMDLIDSRGHLVPNAEIPNGFHFLNPLIVGKLQNAAVVSQILTYLAAGQDYGDGINQTESIDLLPAYFTPMITEPINAAQQKNHTLTVDAGVANWTIALVWNTTANLSLSLRTPSHYVINDTNYATFPNVNYMKNNEVSEAYQIAAPETGSWDLTITARDAPTTYMLTSLFETTLASVAGTNQYSYHLDEPVFILASTVLNATPVAAAMTAEIITPDGNPIAVPLFDDGLHYDLNASDLIFGNSFNDTRALGVYTVAVTANGTIENISFARESSTSFVVERTTDLALQDISFSNEAPLEQEPITIISEVANLGPIDADNVSVFFYDGDLVNGTFINETLAFPLAANQARNVSVQWIPQTSGDHVIVAIVSPFASVQDSNISNDAFNRTISVRSLRLLLAVNGAPRIGQMINFTLYDAVHPRLSYFLGLAFGITQGIPLSDGRVIPLDPDPLLFLTLLAPQAIGLSNNIGTFNAQGQAQAQMAIPNMPELVNVTFYAAFVTIDTALPMPQTVVAITNSTAILIQA